MQGRPTALTRRECDIEADTLPLQQTGAIVVYSSAIAGGGEQGVRAETQQPCGGREGRKQGRRGRHAGNPIVLSSAFLNTNRFQRHCPLRAWGYSAVPLVVQKSSRSQSTSQHHGIWAQMCLGNGEKQVSCCRTNRKEP